MPCDTKVLTPTAKQGQKAALARLEGALLAGSVVMGIGPSGSIAFKGWPQGERQGLTDLCALRKLLASNSPGLRRAIARAEAIAGRRLDLATVKAGVHSHDGGVTWHGGH
jgi:hypothetical protein